jgi:hypothetical protein
MVTNPTGLRYKSDSAGETPITDTSSRQKGHLARNTGLTFSMKVKEKLVMEPGM